MKFLHSVSGAMLLASVAGIICLSSCNPHDEVDTGSLLTAVKKNVFQYEIVTLTPVKITLNSTEYTGTMGSQEVQIIVSEENLVFMVPGNISSDQTLTTTIEGKSYSIDFKVSEAEAIQEPEAYVNNLLKDFVLSLDSYKQMIDTLASGGLVDGDDQKILLAAMQDSFDYYVEQYYELPFEDQQKAAQLIWANVQDLELLKNGPHSLGMDFLLNSNRLKNTLCEEKTRSLQMKCQVNIYNDAYGFTDSGTTLTNLMAVLTRPCPWWSWLAFKIVTMDYSSEAEKYLLMGLSLASVPYHPMFIFGDLPTSFIRNEFQAFTLTVTSRNAKENPSSSNQDWEDTFSKNLNELIRVWNKSVWHKLLAKTVGFPLQITPGMLPESSEVLFLNTMDNSKVAGIIDYVNKRVEIAYNSSESNLQHFRYCIEYYDGIFSVRSDTVDAVLAQELALEGMSVYGWSKIGELCPGSYASGATKMGIQFNAGAPTDGTMTYITYWGGSPNGPFDGNNGTSVIDVAGLERDGNILYFYPEFCWGSAETVLKFEVTYISPTGKPTNLISLIVPFPGN